MASPLKKIFIALLSTAIILLLFFIFAYYNGGFILARILSGKVGTRVTIEKVNFNPQEIQILTTKIRNPKQSTAPFALRIDETVVKAPYMNYLKENIIIDSISLNRIYFTIEFFNKSATKSNWNHIMNELEKSPEARMEGRAQRDSLIKELYLNDLNIEVIIPGKRNKIHRVGNLSFKNIRTEKGELVRRITQAIFMKLIFNISSIVDIPLNFSKDNVDSIFEGFEKINPFKSNGNQNQNAKPSS